MRSIEVPGTDLTISELVLGTMTFGMQVDEAAAGRMLDLCTEVGITMLDTANAYAAGDAERLIGRLLMTRPDRFAVATKAGMPHADAGGDAPLSRPALRSCLHASLQRLGVDRVDLFYLHQPDRATPVEETLAAVEELVQEGKVGALGVSNFAAWQLTELRHVARAAGLTAPTVSQPLYNLVSRRIDEEYVECAAAAGVVNVVYNPLGGGLLTGKHRPDSAPANDGRFAQAGLGAMYRQRYWKPDLFAAVDDLAGVAEQAGLTLIELALGWLLSRPHVGAVLLGASRVEQLEVNVSAARGAELSADVVAACEAVWQQLRGPSPSYNR